MIAELEEASKAESYAWMQYLDALATANDLLRRWIIAREWRVVVVMRQQATQDAEKRGNER